MASQLFGPEMWDILRASPETSAYLADPAFRAVLQEIKDDPATLSKHAGDPRVMQVFGALAAASSGNASMPSNGGATGPPEKKAKAAATVVEDVEEDLDGLPEEERREKMALRFKERGNASYKGRNFEEAIRLYTQAVEMDEKNVALLTNRAAAKFEGGDYEGCVADCKLAIDRNVERSLRTDFKVIARAWARVGNALVKLGRLDDAVEAYAKSLTESHDPKVYQTHKETIRAAEKKRTAEYVDPEKSAAERAEGNALFKAGDFPGSIKRYTEAIKRNPEDAVPYSNRAASYVKLGELPMALKDCDKSLELDPAFIKAYVRKGNIHFVMKEYHKCIETYERGLKVEPNSRELKAGLYKTQRQIQEQQSSGEVDEEQTKRAMADPEIQRILNDSEVQSKLKQMESDPSIANKIMMSDPTFAAQVEKLIAAGVLRVA
jgi:stress-induced-phosphoprotein 1